jgi:hypothetical protein
VVVIALKASQQATIRASIGISSPGSASPPPRSYAGTSPATHPGRARSSKAIDTPSFRLVARNSDDPSSELRVEAVYKLLGLVRTKTAGTLRAGSTWAPTPSVSTVLTLSTVIGTLIRVQSKSASPPLT